MDSNSFWTEDDWNDLIMNHCPCKYRQQQMGTERTQRDMHWYPYYDEISDHYHNPWEILGMTKEEWDANLP